MPKNPKGAGFQFPHKVSLSLSHKQLKALNELRGEQTVAAYFRDLFVQAQKQAKKELKAKPKKEAITVPASEGFSSGSFTMQGPLTVAQPAHPWESEPSNDLLEAVELLSKLGEQLRELFKGGK